jgi:hypothetical protein
MSVAMSINGTQLSSSAPRHFCAGSRDQPPWPTSWLAVAINNKIEAAKLLAGDVGNGK